MKNMIRSLCLALTLVASASAVDRCDVVGSYVAIRTLTDIGNVMYQLQLHADGTVWAADSTSSITPITSGYYSQAIGAWQIKKDIITLTMVEWGTLPVAVDECCDVDVSDFDRFTAELRVIDKNTIESVHRVSTEFPTTADTNTVLSGAGTVIGNATTPFQYKKVRVIPADLL